MRRLKNVVIFIQTFVSFVLSRQIRNVVTATYFFKKRFGFNILISYNFLMLKNSSFLWRSSFFKKIAFDVVLLNRLLSVNSNCTVTSVHLSNILNRRSMTFLFPDENDQNLQHPYWLSKCITKDLFESIFCSFFFQ